MGIVEKEYLQPPETAGAEESRAKGFQFGFVSGRGIDSSIFLWL